MNGSQKQHDDLSAYLDGQMDAAHAQRVEQALRRDEGLARELEQIKAVRAMVRDLPREKAPEDFVARVLERAERQKLMHAPHAGHEARPQTWIRLMAMAAVIMLLVGVGGPIFRTLWRSSQIHKTPVVATGANRDSARTDEKTIAAGPVAAQADRYMVREKETGGKGGMAKGKGGGGGRGGSEESIVVNTDNVCTSMLEVRKVLEGDAIPADDKAAEGTHGYAFNASRYEVQRADADQAEILAMVPQEQVDTLKSRLRGLSQDDIGGAEKKADKAGKAKNADLADAQDKKDLGKVATPSAPFALPAQPPGAAPAPCIAEDKSSQSKPAMIAGATARGSAGDVSLDATSRPSDSKEEGELGMQKDGNALVKVATTQPATANQAADNWGGNKLAHRQSGAGQNMQQMRIIIQNRQQAFANAPMPAASSAPASTSAQTETRPAK